MNKIAILAAFVSLLISCAHGKTDDFPSSQDPSASAEVCIIRDNNLFGWGFTLKVALDNAVIAHLRAGERVSFHVAPGFHSVGITKSSLTVPFERGRKYYFLISADYSSFGFEIQPIGEVQAKYWLAETKPIQ